jgi:hypothetical protein
MIIILTAAVGFLLEKCRRLHDTLKTHNERIFDLELKIQDLQTQIDEAY